MSRQANVGYLLRALQDDPYDIATSTAGSITGTTFTDNTHGTGTYAVGHYLYGSGITPGTYITAMSPTGGLTGTGANSGGTYTVNNSHGTPVVSVAVTGQKEDATAWELIPREYWSVFDGTTERTVEYISDDSFSVGLDSTLAAAAPPTTLITNISRAKKAKVLAPSHGLTTNDIIKITVTTIHRTPSDRTHHSTGNVPRSNVIDRICLFSNRWNASMEISSGSYDCARQS